MLAAAARTSDTALFEKIISAGANPHQAGRTGTTALLVVAQVNDHDAAMLMAKGLFARNVGLARKDHAKRTPLTLATVAGNAALAAALRKCAARLDGRDGNDFTPLDCVASAGQRKMSKLILTVGAEIATQSSACAMSNTIQNAERGGTKDLAELLRQHCKFDL